MAVDEARAFQMTMDLYGQVRDLQDATQQMNEANAALHRENAALHARVQQLQVHNAELVQYLATYEGVQTPDGH